MLSKSKISRNKGDRIFRDDKNRQGLIAQWPAMGSHARLTKHHNCHFSMTCHYQDMRQFARAVRKCLEVVIPLLFLHTSVSAQSRETNVVAMLSPQLRAFLDHDTGAANLLDNVLCEALTNRALQIYYIYSPNEPAAYHYYTEANGVVVAIREDQHALDEFLCLIYEVLNSEHDVEFQELTRRAEARNISKVDFAHEVLRGEFKAALRTKLLISKVKFRKKETSQSYYYKHIAGCPDTFEEFLTSIEKESKNGRDPIKEYEANYDSLKLKSGSPVLEK